MFWAGSWAAWRRRRVSAVGWRRGLGNSECLFASVGKGSELLMGVGTCLRGAGEWLMGAGECLGQESGCLGLWVGEVSECVGEGAGLLGGGGE